MQNRNAFIGALAAALIAPLASFGDTYTWNGGNSGTWDLSSVNWKNVNNESVVWADGNDAVFDVSGGSKQITVGTQVTAANLTGTGGTSKLDFRGVGPLSWTGWATSIGGQHGYFNCPLTDNGQGLHFNFGGHVFLQSANLHTGGTYIKNTVSTSLRAFVIDGAGDGADLALGPVPETVRTNLFIEGGKVALHVGKDKNVTMHKNRTVLIRDGATFYVAPETGGILHINGDIVGEVPSEAEVPLTTSLHVHHNDNKWLGHTVLHGTNYFGKLVVEGNLEIAGGQTRVVTANKGTDGNSAMWIKGNGSSYSTTRGYLLVSGGQVLNYDNSYRFQTSDYGWLDIAGGQVLMNYSKTGDKGEFLNALHGYGKTTIRDGGLLQCSKFRLSQTEEGNGGELFLESGGTLRCRQIGLDFASSRKGAVYFNGGAIQSLEGNDNTSVTEHPNTNTWAGCDFKVEAGGAVFDTSNNQHIWFGRPLLSGVEPGETDGGVVCRIGNGRAVVFHDSARHSYTGPTRLEAIQTGTSTRTLQCRVANALPATTTLQLGPGTRVGFSDWAESSRSELAQTVARVEGTGAVIYNSLLSVTGGVKPSFDGVYGTLSFSKGCASLSGVYEIVADASGCGCLHFDAAGQNISGLTLHVADFSVLNREASPEFYKILDAPNGYVGEFALGNVAKPWRVKYTPTAAYLVREKGFAIIFR